MIAMIKRRHDGKRAGDSRNPIRQSKRRQGWRTIGFAGDVRKTAHRFGERAESGTAGIRTELTKASRAEQDQFWIARLELIPSQVPTLERPRSKVLDQNIRALDQREQKFLPFGIAEIERDGALVAR